MGMLDRVMKARARLTRRRGNAPDVGTLYRSGSGMPAAIGMPVPTYPLNFPGWPDLQQDSRGQLGDLQRAQIAAATSWVFADIQAIARELSVARPRVLEVDGEEENDVPNHPIEQLFNRPNPFMGRSFVLQYWTWQLLLFGRAALFLAPRGGDIAEIWPVPSARITPRRDSQVFISGYEYRASMADAPIIIPPEYIVYTRLPNPFDPYDGLSPIAAMWLAIETDNAQGEWNRNFVGEDNAIPTAVVSTKPDITNSDFQRFRDELLTLFGGGKRRTLVARGGEVDVKLLQFNPEQMQFDKLRHLNREQIDRALGFPEGYWSADATRANSDHARAALISNTVWPLLTLLAEDVSSQTIPVWFDERFHFTWEDIRIENVELLIKQQDSRKDYWTVNELRQADGKEPLPDADPRGRMFIAGSAGGVLPTMTPATEGEAVAQPERSILGYHIEQGVVNRNEAREALGLPPEDIAETERLRDLQAKLSVLKAAAEAGLTTDMGLALVGLTLPEIPATRIPPPPPNPPNPPPAPPMDDGTAIADEEPIDGEIVDDAATATKAVQLLGAAWLLLPPPATMADDLAKWEAKALGRLRRGKRAACAFESAAIPDAIAQQIRTGLDDATDAAAVKIVFQAVKE